MQLRLLELASRIEIVRAELGSRQDEVRQLYMENRVLMAEFKLIVRELDEEILTLASIGLEQSLLTRLMIKQDPNDKTGKGGQENDKF